MLKLLLISTYLPKIPHHFMWQQARIFICHVRLKCHKKYTLISDPVGNYLIRFVWENPQKKSKVEDSKPGSPFQLCFWQLWP